MKIVFTTFFKKGTGGGMGEVAHEIAPAFSLKHEVLLIHSGETTELIKSKRKLLILDIMAHGEGEVCIPDLSSANIKLIFEVLDNFSPDIVHLQDLGLISFLVQIWATRKNIPVVHTSHILPTKISYFGTREFSDRLGQLMNMKVYQKYLTYFFENCNVVIALNKWAQKDILAYGYRGKIAIIPNGRNLRLYNQCQFSDIRQKEKRLLFVGFLSKRKNQMFLLRVMKFLPKNYVLDLIGNYYDIKEEKKLKKFAEQNKLRVNFLGALPHERIPEYLEKAHIFVSASKMEVQSLVILEALASGTPVVGLSNETTDELVNNEVGFNLPKKTSSKLFARKIEEICQLDQEKYIEICQSARKKVADFDWSRVEKQTTTIYREIIRTKKNQKIKTKYKNNDELPNMLSKLFEIRGSLVKSNEFKGDIYIFLTVLFTSLAGSFYSLLKGSKKLKTILMELLGTEKDLTDEKL